MSAVERSSGPMTGNELRDARRIIGEAVLGRELSLDETARLVGLSMREIDGRSNGGDTIRKWEARGSRGGPSGPVAAMLDILVEVAEPRGKPLKAWLRQIILDRLEYE